MFDANGDAKGEFRRIELLTGSVRRRRWSADQKARIVAETLVPGARVSEVARRWQLSSQQVFGWRRAARRDPKTVTPGGPMPTAFVPIVTDTDPVEPGALAVIEVRLAGAVVRVTSGMNDTAQLTAVLRAIRPRCREHDQCSRRRAYPAGDTAGGFSPRRARACGPGTGGARRRSILRHDHRLA